MEVATSFALCQSIIPGISKAGLTPARRLVVNDEFFSTVSGLNFDMCIIFNYSSEMLVLIPQTYIFL